MKLQRLMVVMLATVLVVLVVACGASQGTSQQTPSGSSAERNGGQSAQSTDQDTPSGDQRGGPTQLVGATADSATSLYAYLATLSTVVNQHSENLQLSALPLQGAVVAHNQLKQGRADVVAYPTYIVWQEINGELGDQPWDGTRLLWYAYPAVVHTMVRADSGIESYQDLRGKRVGFTSPGTIAGQIQQIIYNAAGLDVETDMESYFLSVGDLIDGLREGTLDAIGYAPGVGSPAVIELFQTADVRLLPITDELFTIVNESLPGLFQRFTIPSGVYEGVDNPIATVQFPNAVMASTAMPDEIAYEIVSTFLAYRAEAEQRLALVRDTTDELLSAPDAEWLPYHPGALKALRDAGLQQ